MEHHQNMLLYFYGSAIGVDDSNYHHFSHLQTHVQDIDAKQKILMSEKMLKNLIQRSL